MTNEELETKLYEKLYAEQKQFRDWLLSQPPDEVLDHAAEYSVREDIVMRMEDLELTEAQTKAMLKSPLPSGGHLQGVEQDRDQPHGRCTGCN